jgi:uncharacterized Zn-binding protein involved in type VI secretion
MKAQMVRWILSGVLIAASFVQAGSPAARVGDVTSHGGTIIGPGCPTVLIGGMPAARIGDMHVCPMLNPGMPPVPHIGGPIALGSLTVMIGGMPAARLGDMAVCNGPPATIVLGCPTVLIGDAGGGGGSAEADSGQTTTVPESENEVKLKSPKLLTPPTVLKSTAVDKQKLSKQISAGLSHMTAGEKIITPEGIVIQSTGKYVRIEAGPSKIYVDPSGGVTIESDQVNIQSSGDLNLSAMNVNISAQMDVNIKGMDINSEADMKNTIKGMDILSEASMKNTIKGTHIQSEASVNNTTKGAYVNSEASAMNALKATGNCTIQGGIVQIN